MYSTDERYSEKGIRYDFEGNIRRLTRNGLTRKTDGRESCYQQKTIDFLRYGYTGNQVVSIEDYGDDQAGFVDGASAATEYRYDANGSMIGDLNKNLTIEYNLLHLPKRFRLPNGKEIRIAYDGSGAKLKKTIFENGTILSAQSYIGGIEYRKDTLEAIYHPEGRAVPKDDGSDAFRYEYSIRDHLGNTRITFSDLNDDGFVNAHTEVLQEEHYYPFGLGMTGPWETERGNLSVTKYKFLGREGIQETGFVDLMKRMYDPSYGRFDSVDPSPDVEEQESLTPYQYGWNNPVLRSDPNGDCPNCLTAAIGAGIGALVGGGVEIGRQLWNDGKVSNWSAVGGATLQGGITGGAAGFTGGASLLVTTGVSAGANMLGGALNNSIQGKEITLKSVATDAAVGVVAGVGGKILDKVLKPDGIVYLRTNPRTGGEYIGQAKNQARFLVRQAEHDAKLGVKHQYQVLDRAKPGVKLDVAEESAIRLKGGPKTKSNPNGTLENKRYQMDENRYRAAGGKVDKPN